ncbi:MAG: hypothetical protein ACRDG3_09700, partial [Tepidiformaceae bacterium]
MSGLVLRGALAGALGAIAGLLVTAFAFKAGAGVGGWVLVVVVALVLGSLIGALALVRSDIAVRDVT